MIAQPFKAIGAFFQAIPLLLKPQLRLFLLIPLLINIVLIAILYTVAFHYFADLVDYFMAWVPSWLFFLDWLFYIGFVLLSGLLLFYGFSVGVNILAAPFNGLLAERVEAELTGECIDEPFSVKQVTRLMIDSILRELQKIGYFLPRMLALFILSFIPVINVVSPVLWLLFGAWVLAIQYLDYAFDNNKVSFKDMRLGLREKPLLCWSFGLIVMVLLPIPLVNLIVMPLAVVAATILWLNTFKDYYSSDNEQI